MRPHHPTIILLAAVALLAGACGGPADPGAGGGTDDLDGDWELVEGTGPDGPVPILDDHPITLSVDGEEVDGTSACNSYGGRFDGDAGALTVDELFQTDMACMPDEVMASEAAYLEALVAVEQADHDGDELVLTGPDVELRFAPDAAADGDT